jgi:DNA-binding NarL/FixJ family response regulator
MRGPAADALPVDEDADLPNPVLLVGEWPAVEEHRDTLVVGQTVLVRSDMRVRACQLALSNYHPRWMVLGVGADDRHRNTLLHASRLVSPDLQVAVLGPEEDLAACDRWLRRGTRACLSVDNPVERVLAVIAFCERANVVVIDKCFQHLPQHQRLQPVSRLTRRETEVLHCVRRGSRNQEIADELQVSVSTVDFHIRNLLAKLGARNRLEAVRRADSLGL